MWTHSRVVCEQTGDHHLCSYFHKQSSEATRLSVGGWGGERSLKMALKPTTNQRWPLSAGHTRPLEPSALGLLFQTSAVQEGTHLFWYVWSPSALPCLPLFFLLIPFSWERLLLTEEQIIKWVVERPVFGHHLVYLMFSSSFKRNLRVLLFISALFLPVRVAFSVISAFPTNYLDFVVNLLKAWDWRLLKRWCAEHLCFLPPLGRICRPGLFTHWVK